MSISSIPATRMASASTADSTTSEANQNASAAPAPVAGGAPKAGGGAAPLPGIGDTDEDTLAAIIEAAKRRVQNIIGPAQVDEVVAEDGSINYQKLADLVNEQQLKKLAASNEPVANLLA